MNVLKGQIIQKKEKRKKEDNSVIIYSQPKLFRIGVSVFWSYFVECV